jgi:hypothetical protein
VLATNKDRGGSQKRVADLARAESEQAMFFRIGISAAAVIFSGQNVFADTYCRKDGVERFTEAGCRALYATSKPAPTASDIKLINPHSTSPAPTKTDPIVRAVITKPPAPTSCDDLSWLESHMFLRQSLKDLGNSFDCNNVSALDKSAGANLSWASDGVQHNRTFSTQGLIGISTGHWGEAGMIQDQLAAAYFGWNRSTNSLPTQKKKNVDDLTYGLMHEIGFGPIFEATHYFRSRFEADTDSDGSGKNWTVGIQWQPAGALQPRPENNTIFSYMGTPLPAGWYILTVSPSYQVEYSGSLNGSTDPLFATHKDALRTGPGIAISLVPNGDAILPDAFKLLRYISFNFSYDYLYDTLAARNYKLLTTSAIYNFDDTKRYALTLSYNRGELETTGQAVNLIKLALSAKFGGLPTSPKPPGSQ